MNFAHGRVLAKEGVLLRVTYGAGCVTARCAASLLPTQVEVGDQVLLGQVWDVWWAWTRLGVNDSAMTARIALGASGGGGGGGGSSSINDVELVRRDGTHDLYAMARWVWQQGAEIAGVLRSWGNGLLQVFGALYAGQRAGAHAGLFNYQTDAGVPTAVHEVADAANVPIFSAWAADGDDPDDAAVNIGRAGYPRIHFETVAGYDRKLPLVDAALLTGEFNSDNMDTAALNEALDHGLLQGNGDDDHPQYATEERGDLRWAQLDHSHAARLAVMPITDDYAALGTEDLIIADTATILTVTLPSSSGSGKLVIVKAVGAGAVTVAGAGADTLDGDTDMLLAQWDVVRLCDYAEGLWCVL